MHSPLSAPASLDFGWGVEQPEVQNDLTPKAGSWKLFLATGQQLSWGCWLEVLIFSDMVAWLSHSIMSHKLILCKDKTD